MRPTSSCTRLLLLSAFTATLCATVALGQPEGARAGKGHSPKLDPRLSVAANAADPNARLDVVILGADAKGAGQKLGLVQRDLGLVGGVAAKIKAKDLDKLADDSGVSFVSADVPVAPQSSPIDYSKLATMYPFTVKANKVWDAGYTGRGVGIAVIDSGIAASPDFGSRLVQVTLPTQSWANGDVHGHGTLVAGIAGGQSADGKYIGVAPGASVYALNVNNPAGVHSSDVIDALQWVYENAHTYNIRVVNLSLSETVPSTYTQSTLDLAVERVWAAGVMVVVAAGNNGLLSGAVDYAPANDPLALAVGATDTMGTKDMKDDIITSFSSSGITQAGFGKPEIYAPGRLIASTLPSGTYLDMLAPLLNRVAPGYVTISGTSFSAPQVAGAAAIEFQQHPDWSPDQIKWLLVQRAKPLPALATVKVLDIDGARSFDKTPSLANQGVPALVCAPTTTCLNETTVASLWDSSSWNSSSWNSSSWNSSSWNTSSWNSSSWNSSSWNTSSWNSSSWNSSSWNTSSWNSSSWD